MARSISDEELQLKRRARRRLIGAIVLVTALVVALPMVLDTEPKPIGSEVNIKIPSSDPGSFTSRLVPVAPPGQPGTQSAAKPSPDAKSAPRVAAAPEGKKSSAASAAVSERKSSAAASTAAPSPEASAAIPEKSAKPAAPQTAAKAPDAAPKNSAAKKPAAPPFVVQVVALADAEKAKQVQAQIAAA